MINWRESLDELQPFKPIDPSAGDELSFEGFEGTAPSLPSTPKPLPHKGMGSFEGFAGSFDGIEGSPTEFAFSNTTYLPKNTEKYPKGEGKSDENRNINTTGKTFKTFKTGSAGEIGKTPSLTGKEKTVAVASADARTETLRRLMALYEEIGQRYGRDTWLALVALPGWKVKIDQCETAFTAAQGKGETCAPEFEALRAHWLEGLERIGVKSATGGE